MRSITLFALLCTRLAAADMRPEWTVLYGHEEFRKADTMLQDYLRKARSAAETDREMMIAAIRTPAALQQYQTETAAHLLAILGEFPARTPLNPKIAGRLERSGYTVEKAHLRKPSALLRHRQRVRARRTDWPVPGSDLSRRPLGRGEILRRYAAARSLPGPARLRGAGLRFRRPGRAPAVLGPGHGAHHSQPGHHHVVCNHRARLRGRPGDSGARQLRRVSGLGWHSRARLSQRTPRRRSREACLHRNVGRRSTDRVAFSHRSAHQGLDSRLLRRLRARYSGAARSRHDGCGCAHRAASVADGGSYGRSARRSGRQTETARADFQTVRGFRRRRSHAIRNF